MKNQTKLSMAHANTSSILTVVCLLLFLSISIQSNAAGSIQKPTDEVSFIATSASKGSIFKSGDPIEYNISIVNSLPTKQDGKITYRITDLHNKFVCEDSVKIKIGANGSKQLLLSAPARRVGFYKINLMINVSDYDDTIRRAFGVDPDKIRSPYAKPADFDQFWKSTKAQLAAVKPEFKMTEVPDSNREDRKVYLVEMRSLDNILIRGWLTIPNSTNKNKKFTVLLGLPGYQVNLKPGFGGDDDIAIFFINVRGQGNSRDVIQPDRAGYLTYNIDDKNKYVMRGAIMDCIRAVDFVCTVPQLDKDKIVISGGSMGGFLAVATAGLDDRVKLFSAQNPIFSDIRNLPTDYWPMNDIIRYIKIKPELTLDKVYSNLDYFDTKNFATNINNNILVGIGLLDPLAPPQNEYAFYNNIRKNKKIMVFENLGHEVPKEFSIYQARWMVDSFALF